MQIDASRHNRLFASIQIFTRIFFLFFFTNFILIPSENSRALKFDSKYKTNRKNIFPRMKISNFLISNANKPLILLPCRCSRWSDIRENFREFQIEMQSGRSLSDTNSNEMPHSTWQNNVNWVKDHERVHKSASALCTLWKSSCWHTYFSTSANTKEIETERRTQRERERRERRKKNTASRDRNLHLFVGLQVVPGESRLT